VTANVFGQNVNGSTFQQIPIIGYDEDITSASRQIAIPVQISSLAGSVGASNPLPISGAVTIGAGTAQIGSVTASISGTVPVSISSVTISNFPASQSVTFTDASLTNTQLRASAVTIGGTVTVGNSLTIGSLPAISGVVTANVTTLAFTTQGGIASFNGGTAPSYGVLIGFEDDEGAFNTVNGVRPLPVGGDVSILGFDNSTGYPIPIQVTSNGSVFASLSSALPAGTNQIGSVTASISGTVPISISSVTVGNSVTIASLPAISGTVTANLSSQIYGETTERYAIRSAVAYIDGGDLLDVTDLNPLPVTLLNSSALPAGTNRIGVVTIGAGTVTIGAGTAQIGSVTASINGTVPISISSVTIGNSVTISSLPAISGTVTANIGLNELPYIKINVSVTNVATDNLTTNVYLRRIAEYSYESIRYQGNEDEAYVKVVLEVGGESTQKIWRLYSLGDNADLQGLVAYVLPQTNEQNGSPFPPKTGWTLGAGITGTLSFSYEQPSAQLAYGNNGLDGVGGNVIPLQIAYNDEAFADGRRLAVSIVNSEGLEYTTPLPISGTVTIGSALPAGTNRIGVVTIGAGTVTIGAGTSQIGSVTASISGTVPISISSVTVGNTVAVKTDLDANSSQPCVAVAFDSPAGVQRVGNTNGFPIRPMQDGSGNSIPLAISGTVTVGNTVTIANIQGTEVTTSNFTSTAPSTVLAGFNATREVLTIFNEGAGNLHICAGVTCTTLAYQVRLSAGDYYEAPLNQTSLTHSAVFATNGTARVTQVR
jgi:hypothetical protein